MTSQTEKGLGLIAATATERAIAFSCDSTLSYFLLRSLITGSLYILRLMVSFSKKGGTGRLAPETKPNFLDNCGTESRRYLP